MSVLDIQCPIEKDLSYRANKVEWLGEKDPLGELILKPYDPKEYPRAERVYYYPHIPGKPQVFSFNCNEGWKDQGFVSS